MITKGYVLGYWGRQPRRKPSVTQRQRYFLKVLFLLMPLTAAADDALDDAWFDDDLEMRFENVNGGELVFLTEPPPEPVHHHQSRIILNSGSLESGWVTVIQCHTHLDAVPRSQVMYHRTRARDLLILSHANIEKAWVEGHTVQLADVEQGASLCIQVRLRALELNANGTFSLRGGPYMRRFLDGYYPMHVSMRIEVPRESLRFLEIQPHRQDGFKVRETAEGIEVDTWFEGKLYTEIIFAAESCEKPHTSTC